MTRDEDSNSPAFRILNKANSKQTDQACLIIIYHHLIGQTTPLPTNSYIFLLSKLLSVTKCRQTDGRPAGRMGRRADGRADRQTDGREGRYGKSERALNACTAAIALVEQSKAGRIEE